MQPMLFTLVRLQTIRSARLVGNPRLLPGILPLPAVGLRINGITKTGAGGIVGSAVVKLYRTETDQMMEAVISDASTGAFSFGLVGLGQAYYVVAYKAGAPDLAGTTLNTLMASGPAIPADVNVFLRDPTTQDAAGSASYRPVGSPVIRRLA